MSWASHRRALIVALLAVFGVFIVAVTGIATFYRAPSCSDGVQNQGEAGIDCGGPCPYLCSSQVSPPSVRFTRSISDEPGRTDVIAYIDNPNATAASFGAPYEVSLYDADNVLVAHTSGTTELPPVSTVPVFIPGVFSGSKIVARAFLSFTGALPWQTYHDVRVIPTIATPEVSGAPDAPRITAVVGNPSASPLANVKLIVTVFDAGGTAIAASQTVVPVVDPQGTALATFTWNVPFSASPAKIEVIPIVPL